MSMSVLVLALVLSVVQAADVAGCGGVVRFENQEWVKHAALQVELLSDQNRVLETTAVSPNGYFFLPCETGQKGRLRVQGPSGWRFAPRETAAECGSGGEGRFEFEGVVVESRVGCEGCAVTQGPQNVRITLGKHSTLTNEQGGWKVEGVRPGDYTLVCERGSWNHTAQVSVGYDGSVSGEIPSFDGFSVRGRCEGQWKEGVEIRLGEFQTISDAQGHWVLESIPSGQHQISATLTRQGRAYQLEPSSVEVTIATEDVEVSTPFKVDKFVVQGSLPAGLEGVVLLVDGKERSEVVIDADGKYSLPVSEGSRLTLSAKKSGVVFSKTSFDGSRMTEVPAITVESYLSCFEFRGLANTQASVTVGPHRNVLVGAEPVCLALKEGLHPVEVSNVQVHPIPPLKVSSTPPPTTVIRQVVHEVKGSVKLVKGFGSSNIKISLDGTDQTTTLGADHTFRFGDLTSAEHSVSITDDLYCFDQATVKVASAKDSVVFTQTGLLFRQECHQEAPQSFRVNGKSFSYECKQGVANEGVCIPVNSNEPVEVFAEGGVVFEPKSVVLDVKSTGQVRFNQVASRVTGTLKGDGRLTVVAQGEERVVEVKDGRFEVDVPLRKTFFMKCTPSKADELCYPREITSPSSSYDFVVRSGKVLAGAVEPAVAGVKMTVTCDQEEYTAMTTAAGKFSIGPIRGESCSEVKGSHPDYSVVASDKDGQFQLHPLSSLTVTVLDASQRPVSDCVLSMSGDNNFRRNELTGADGSFKFQSVPPGEYYVQAMLKEYKFNPGHASVTLTSTPQTVSFSGTRVAYSAFGSVMGLTQEPEKVVTVVASLDGKVVTEAKTDEKGLFRLRGLKPGQKYEIRPEDPRLERSAPLAATVEMKEEDTKGIEFVALRQTQKMEVAGIVAVDPQYGPSLRVELLNSEGRRVASANQSQYFDFRQLPVDSYTLYCHSDVSDRTHIHETVKVPISLKLPLKASEGISVVHQRRVFVTVAFGLTERSVVDQAQLESSPAFGALVFLLAVAVFVFRETVLETVRGLMEKKKGGKSKTPAKKTEEPLDKAASFLQGTALGQTGKKKNRK